ncbi:hypothetical protein EON80_32585, partial [bacterium]
MNKSAPSNPKMTRRNLLRSVVRGGAGLGAMSLSSVAWSAVEVDWVEVNQIEIKMARLPRAFDGFRIAQISDIHIEGADMEHRLPEVTRYIASLGVDMVALTGDYTTNQGD